VEKEDDPYNQFMIQLMQWTCTLHGNLQCTLHGNVQCTLNSNVKGTLHDNVQCTQTHFN